MDASFFYLSIGVKVSHHFQEESLYLESVLNGKAGIIGVNDISQCHSLVGDVVFVSAVKAVLVIVGDGLHDKYNVVHSDDTIVISISPYPIEGE